MSKAIIRVKGAWAVLSGVSDRCLRETLMVDDPKRFYVRAFKERRWDGKVALYDGMKFPAGLIDRVSKWLVAHRVSVDIVSPIEDNPIDSSLVVPDLLPGITLWKHQTPAVRAMLTHRIGIIQSPTASGKTEDIIAASLLFWRERGWRTLVVVPRKGLAKQTVARFRKYLGDSVTIGQCGDGQKTFGEIVVGTAQTLIGFQAKRRFKRNVGDVLVPGCPKLKKLIANFEVLILDETHHASADMWYTIAMCSGAFRRYGLSGTPIKNQELADLRMTGATGPIIHTVDTAELLTAGLVTKPKIAIVMADNASAPIMERTVTLRRDVRTKEIIRVPKYPSYADAYTYAIVESEEHRRAVIRASCWLVDHGRQTLVLCRIKKQFLALQAEFEKLGLDFLSVWGDTATKDRDQAKRRMEKNELQIILASSVFDEGEDLKGVQAMVLAEGVKVNTKTLQRIGRGMRRQVEGVDDLWVVDFVPVCHPKLVEHGLARCVAYESRGYETVIVDSWPKHNAKNFDEGKLLPFDAWDRQFAGAAR